MFQYHIMKIFTTQKENPLVMKIRFWNEKILTFSVCCMVIIALSSTPAKGDDSTMVRITANGATVPINVASSDQLNWAISVYPGKETGIPGDWWLYAKTPLGGFYYDVFHGGWVMDNIKISFQGPLFDLHEVNVFNGNGLPDGVYKLFFGIDTNMDGYQDRDWVFSTSKVNISSNPVSDEVITQNNFIYKKMKNVYLWNTKLPDIDYTQYASPEGLLTHLMYDQLDKWSYINSVAAHDSWFQEGKYIGFGFLWRYEDSTTVRFAYVYENSPAEQAGITRGHKILAVNGFSIAEIEAGGLWDSILGDDQIGVQAVLRVEDLQGTVRELTLFKDWVTSKSVMNSFTSTHSSHPNKVIGYLLFSSFIEPSYNELRSVFSFFKQQNVTDLVLDLRYNGGGRTDVANFLASLIKGYQGKQEFYRLVHNSNLQDWDESSYLSAQAESLNLSKVVIITSSSTCSASELVINGLQPYIDVVLVGKRTCGKPVGMYSWQFGDKIIHPISFEVVNALGEGGYYHGIAITCDAKDELTEEIGSSLEDSLEEARHVVFNGGCSMQSRHFRQVDKAKKSYTIKEIPLHGFRTEVGAF